MVSKLFCSTLFLILFSLFWICTPGQMFFFFVFCFFFGLPCAMDVTCIWSCVLVQYIHTIQKQTCIHTQFIYYFSLCIKSIYRYMYINYNGSEIIYGELISGRAVAIFAAA